MDGRNRSCVGGLRLRKLVESSLGLCPVAPEFRVYYVAQRYVSLYVSLEEESRHHLLPLNLDAVNVLPNVPIRET